MVCRTCEVHLATLFNFYPERQRVSRLVKVYAGLPKRDIQSNSIFTSFINVIELICPVFNSLTQQ